MGFPGGSDGKESACSEGDLGLIPGSGRPLKKGMATHSGILACKFHGQRNLVGYSPWGHKESDMTERLITHASVLQKDLNLSVAQRTMFYESYGHNNKL